MIDPMTRQGIHIHREAGLTHKCIAELTRASVNTVKRVLQEDLPTPLELAPTSSGPSSISSVAGPRPTLY